MTTIIEYSLNLADVYSNLRLKRKKEPQGLLF